MAATSTAASAATSPIAETINQPQLPIEQVPQIPVETLRAEARAKLSADFFVGAIDGALFAYCIPDNWNHKLIISWQEGIALVADLNPGEEVWAHFIGQGWAVGLTSYRRPGLIVKDAIADVNNLRKYIEDTHGKLEQTLLEGRSMGGCIVTLIAENHPYWYQGCVAIGAALYVKELIPEPMKFSHCPLSPLIFLTNSSELGIIQSYLDKCVGCDGVYPALWEVSREGHNMANQAERINALTHLLCWIQFNSFITMRKHNGTLLPDDKKSVASFEFDNRKRPVSGSGKMTGTSVWGCVTTNFIEADLKELNIRYGTHSKFRFQSARGPQIVGKLSTYPFVDCEIGSWIGFIDADGYFVVTILTHTFVNPAHKASIALGEPFSLRSAS